MEKRLFVGNLSYDVDEKELESAFASCGKVVGAVVIRDHDTGRSRGFGFVEMETEEMAESAVDALNGFEIEGRRIRVNAAQPKRDAQRRTDFGERW